MTQRHEPRRTPSLNICKAVCWVLFASGTGTMLTMLLLFLSGQLAPIPPVWTFLMITAAVVSVASGLVLRTSYRREPANFAGFWHLSLAELIAATFFIALLMAVFRGIWPAYFPTVGIAITLMLGLGFTFCLLLATRKGCSEMSLKLACAFGYYLLALGIMSAGMFFLVVGFASLYEGETYQGLHELFMLVNIFGEIYPDGDKPIFYTVRAGIICIPIGFLLLRWVDARLKSSRREALPTDQLGADVVSEISNTTMMHHEIAKDLSDPKGH